MSLSRQRLGWNGVMMAVMRLDKFSECLPFQAPLCPDNLFGHLIATAVPGVEEWREGVYRRTLRLPFGCGIAALQPFPDHVACTVELSDPRDLASALDLCRFLLDLDADPFEVDGALSADPLLAPLVSSAPGRRVPRTVDGAEFAIRAVLGQQVSTKAARTHAARLVARYGTPVGDLFLFPLEFDPADLAMPESRRRTMAALLEALRSGLDLSPVADRTVAREWLSSLPGFGPWTVESILMRALGDPDAFLPTDLGIRLAAEALGLPSTPAALVRRSEAWRPWRAYAVQHLWATGDHEVNQIPA
ncbi:DNA-3-methyladenine glycosylase 2 family protein [Lentzea sp. PSKA42]|uniref:DNA-3-methyladenine glycosylase II n=1 Tax=Lentzea indica TaxID=2604800 RepID=A0ABX1FCT0_9PSEU|nr:DNA-3-methyladenine glycosylase 2 family protein [Lentzea indica]NKE56729.1 DNA-3-methyladenine glycosylase 2 family protein [Lentzea indica]